MVKFILFLTDSDGSSCGNPYDLTQFQFFFSALITKAFDYEMKLFFHNLITTYFICASVPSLYVHSRSQMLSHCTTLSGAIEFACLAEWKTSFGSKKSYYFPPLFPLAIPYKCCGAHLSNLVKSV
jgi:hypothetical protein